ncbi:hypothetical protein BH23PSE2_BH23PSE2_00120 [soil metagenome]
MQTKLTALPIRLLQIRPRSRRAPPPVVAAALACALLAGPAMAQGSGEPPLPAWEGLTAQQREALIAPIRERWDANPGHRARMLEHAQRWRELTPEQRKHARHGADRWAHMSPGQQREMRALYAKLRSLPEDERRALRERWKAMTPEQRRAWIEANPPPQGRGER